QNRTSSLEFEPGFTRRIRQDLDSSVVAVSAAVEDDLVVSVLLEPSRDLLADRLRRVQVPAVLQPERLAEARGGGNRLAGLVVHGLHVDVAQAAEDDEPRARRSSRELLADAVVRPRPLPVLVRSMFHRRSYLAPVFPTFLRTISPT